MEAYQMENARDEAVKACLTGIQIEKNGYSFYTSAAERTRDPKGKSVLLHLARQEQHHEKVLADVIEQLQAGQPRSRSAHMHATVFPQPTDFSKTLRDEVSELEVLKIALEMEHRTINFFTNARKRSFNTEAVPTFDLILAEEEKHVRLIESEIDYLTAQGVWMGIREIDQDG